MFRDWLQNDDDDNILRCFYIGILLDDRDQQKKVQSAVLAAELRVATQKFLHTILQPQQCPDLRTFWDQLAAIAGLKFYIGYRRRRRRMSTRRTLKRP